MFVDTSSFDKLTARTTTVSHFAAGEVLSVDEELGGQSVSSNANTWLLELCTGQYEKIIINLKIKTLRIAAYLQGVEKKNAILNSNENILSNLINKLMCLHLF